MEYMSLTGAPSLPEMAGVVGDELGYEHVETCASEIVRTSATAALQS